MEWVPTGSGAWHDAHGPAKIRRPSASASAEAPRAALTIAGVTGGATFTDDAQPPAASALTAQTAEKRSDGTRMSRDRAV